MVTINIPCPHEAGTAEDNETVSDYHPLSKDEIKELLDMSTQTNDAVELAKIQVRLNQGIKGMTCPRPYDDSQTCRNEAKMDELYVRRHHVGGTDELVDLFYELLNW